MTFARKVANLKIELRLLLGLTKNHGRRCRERGRKQSISGIVPGKSNSHLFPVKSRNLPRGISREIARNKSTKSGENSSRVGRNNDVTDVTSSQTGEHFPSNGKNFRAKEKNVIKFPIDRDRKSAEKKKSYSKNMSTAFFHAENV